MGTFLGGVWESRGGEREGQRSPFPLPAPPTGKGPWGIPLPRLKKGGGLSPQTPPPPPNLLSPSQPESSRASPAGHPLPAHKTRQPGPGTMEQENSLGVDDKLRLILVGKTGGGKSATGNTILGRPVFKSLLGATATTLKCQRGEGRWQGKKIFVVDTPAIFDSANDSQMMQNEIQACIELSRPGPHALIFVTQVGRFTTEDAAAAKRVRAIFGTESTRHMVILFTCKEDLGGDSLQEFVQKSDNRNLRSLIRQCGNRFCGFNNKAAEAERESQVSELMAMVARVVSENGGNHYVPRLPQAPDVGDRHVRLPIKGQNECKRASKGYSKKTRVWIGSVCIVTVIVIVIVLAVQLS